MLVEARPDDVDGLPGPRLEQPVVRDGDFSTPPLPPIGTREAVDARKARASAAATDTFNDTQLLALSAHQG